MIISCVVYRFVLGRMLRTENSFLVVLVLQSEARVKKD